jgi:hypothetical protein
VRCRNALGVAALAPCLAWTGCAGTGEAPEKATQPTPAHGPAHLDGAVRLRGRYEFEGRSRSVDAEVAVDHPIDPFRASVAAREPGERLVAVRLRLLNRGRDSFPADWARFRGYDGRGRVLAAGTQGTPLRKSLPDRAVRGQTLTSLVAFRVPRRRKLASVRMSSIVELWDFRARWRLEQ